MSQRLLQIFILFLALTSGALLAHVTEPGQASDPALRISFDAGAASAPGGAQKPVSGVTSPDNSHTAPCYLECLHPFLRHPGQAQASHSSKHKLITHLNAAHQTDAVTARSGWLSGQFRMLYFTPAGSPYQAHRARTARQLA